MARLARIVIPHVLHHLIQSSHEGMPLFREPEDYTHFLTWLLHGARQFKIAIHAYVLLPGHFHLLLTPEDEQGPGKLMQWLGRYYVPYFNRKYLRTGSLWQGRYKAAVLDPLEYFLVCSVYVESHPVRAGLAEDAAAYPWSSYQHHIGQKLDPLVSDHALFWALGNTPFQREANYRDLVQQSLSSQQIQMLTAATHKGWPLGSPDFRLDMAKRMQRRVEPAPRGRPRKLP